MIMHYDDLTSLSLSNTPGNRTLKFRAGEYQLLEFKDDYDVNNRQHFVSIEFGSGSDVALIREKVIPLIKKKK